MLPKVDEHNIRNPLISALDVTNIENIKGGKDFFRRELMSQNPEQACNLLFKDYYQILCNHALKFVYNKMAAEDIVSSIFLEFWEKKLYQNISYSYKAYFFRAVRNRCLNYFTRELHYNLSIDIDTQDLLVLNDTPESIMQLDELSQKIEQIIHTLPAQCQKVFIMSRLEGLKIQEIATAMQIAGKTVEAHLTKALKIVKESLNNEEI
jgi:RNA polymerase sigma-70 factor (family 1)